MVISLGHTLRVNLVAAVRGTKNLQMPRQERETLLSLLTFVECTSAIGACPDGLHTQSLTHSRFEIGKQQINEILLFHSQWAFLDSSLHLRADMDVDIVLIKYVIQG